MLAGCARSQLSMFQSAPGGEAGGKGQRRPEPSSVIRFNPPPAVRPGERVVPLGLPVDDRFNPPPAVRPGERTCTAQTSLRVAFQSAPGGEAGGKRRSRTQPDLPHVSIRPRR